MLSIKRQKGSNHAYGCAIGLSQRANLRHSADAVPLSSTPTVTSTGENSGAEAAGVFVSLTFFERVRPVIRPLGAAKPEYRLASNRHA